MSDSSVPRQLDGILGWVERIGDKLPDPVFIFFYLIIALMAISVITSMAGVNAPVDKEFLSTG